MSSVNKVILIGNLGKDPEVRFMPSGDAIANITLATSENWTDKASGQRKEATEWHRVAFFGRLAEVVQQYVHKGSKIYLEGKLKTRKWQDKDGSDRYTTEIHADRLQMLDKKPEGGEQRSERSAAPAPAGDYANRRTAPAATAGGGSTGFEDMDDDVPFKQVEHGDLKNMLQVPSGEGTRLLLPALADA